MASCCTAKASKQTGVFPALKKVYDCAKNSHFPAPRRPALETRIIFDVYGKKIDRPFKVFAHSVLREEECPICYETMASPCIMLRKRDADSAEQICRHNVCLSCAEKIVNSAIESGPAEISSCPLCRGHFCAVAKFERCCEEKENTSFSVCPVTLHSHGKVMDLKHLLSTYTNEAQDLLPSCTCGDGDCFQSAYMPFLLMESFGLDSNTQSLPRRCCRRIQDIVRMFDYMYFCMSAKGQAPESLRSFSNGELIARIYFVQRLVELVRRKQAIWERHYFLTMKELFPEVSKITEHLERITNDFKATIGEAIDAMGVVAMATEVEDELQRFTAERVVATEGSSEDGGDSEDET